MNYKMMGKFISQILFVEAAFMLPALLLSIVYGEQSAVRGFIGAIIITLIVAAIMYVLCRNAVKRFYAREGLVCVGMSWIALSIMGCLPFFISREIPDFLDALFEIVSGFTTTGSSILTDVEALSHGSEASEEYSSDVSLCCCSERSWRKRIYVAYSPRRKPGTKCWKTGSEDAYDCAHFICDLCVAYNH